MDWSSAVVSSDLNLAGDEIDQPAVDEMRGYATRALLVKDDRFLLDSRQTADARADRNASAVTLFFAHVGEAGILQRLAGGVYAVDDERIDLPLHLVVDALAGIEIGRAHV